MKKILEVENLRISYLNNGSRTDAVKDISFILNENEVLGVVGESGSGKTVTALSIMRILSHEANISSGRILFEGKDLLSICEKDMENVRGRNISMIFQEPFSCLNPVMTVGEQIGEIYRFHELSAGCEIKKQVLQLLEKVKFAMPEKTYDSYPHMLSGGERQRVMIAMSVALDPRILIADEPTTALDVTVQAEILRILCELKKECGLSMIFITHDLGIISKIADRVMVMKDGKIVEENTKSGLLSKPKEEYTKRLISAAMHLSSGAAETAGENSNAVIFEARNVTKSFPIEKGILRKETGRFYAVKNVSFAVRKGVTAGLVGQSGCGKSTLAKIILGLEKPDSGQILFEGGDITNFYSRRVRGMMQIVFQDPFNSLNPGMRMRDIVLEGTHMLKLDAGSREDILRDVLGKVRLSYNDRFKFPHQFSGGQRQRIAIARALAVRPSLLVLDEPVSSLDVLIQQDIIALLKKLKTEMGLTYLFISHDLGLIKEIADEVYVMNEGIIVEHGTVEDVYYKPKDTYTKKLIESVPVLTKLTGGK